MNQSTVAAITLSVAPNFSARARAALQPPVSSSTPSVPGVQWKTSIGGCGQSGEWTNLIRAFRRIEGSFVRSHSTWAKTLVGQWRSHKMALKTGLDGRADFVGIVRHMVAYGYRASFNFINTLVEVSELSDIEGAHFFLRRPRGGGPPYIFIALGKIKQAVDDLDIAKENFFGHDEQWGGSITLRARHPGSVRNDIRNIIRPEVEQWLSLLRPTAIAMRRLLECWLENLREVCSLFELWESEGRYRNLLEETIRQLTYVERGGWDCHMVGIPDYGDDEDSE